MNLEKTIKNNQFIIAIIPDYNEEKNIEKVIQKCKKYVDQIIVVDDGSTDNTLQIDRNMNVITIWNKNNLGKTESLKIRN